MIAFIDESIREIGQNSVGAYVIGCVVAPGPECAELRKRLSAGGRFHFYKAGPQRRAGMLALIGRCRLVTVAYVYRGLYPVGEEGARAACLRRLLRDLMLWEVNQLVIESRGSADVKDRVTILSAINAHDAPHPFRYDWVSGNADPMLWMPDAIAGSVRANIRTADYEDALKKLGTVTRRVP